jgi:hypothetical protein
LGAVPGLDLLCMSALNGGNVLVCVYMAATIYKIILLPTCADITDATLITVSCHPRLLLLVQTFAEQLYVPGKSSATNEIEQCHSCSSSSSYNHGLAIAPTSVGTINPSTAER